MKETVIFFASTKSNSTNFLSMDPLTAAVTPAGFPGGSFKIPQGILPPSVLNPNYKKGRFGPDSGRCHNF
jgi:hypothetical protein